jgi:DNA/RNA-binding domain of Phe-tRNA-synthetase-like protein
VNIEIDPELRAFAPQLALGTIVGSVRVISRAEVLWSRLVQRADEIARTLDKASLATNPEVQALRHVYRSLGTDSSRYRGSQEALCRRILQGKSLYQINSIVDINIFVSISSLHSVGTYDLGRIELPIRFRVGKHGESYQGIAKGDINVAGFPVFSDANGPFGSPTGDSRRTMIRPDTTELFFVVISFSGSPGLPGYMDLARSLLEEFGELRHERRADRRSDAQ